MRPSDALHALALVFARRIARGRSKGALNRLWIAAVAQALRSQ